MPPLEEEVEVEVELCCWSPEKRPPPDVVPNLGGLMILDPMVQHKNFINNSGKIGENFLLVKISGYIYNYLKDTFVCGY